MRRVLIAYDGDDAGDTAARRLAATLTGEGVECFRIAFPAGADANDVARDTTAPTDTLGRLIRAAAWMGSGLAPTRRAVTCVPPHDADADDGGDGADDGGDDGGPGARDGCSFAAAAAPGPAGPPAALAPQLVSPTPALPPQVAPVVDGDELRVALGDRRWRVRGLAKVTSFDLLRVNVLVARHDGRGDRFHVDTLDLYSARARTVFAKQDRAAGVCVRRAERRFGLRPTPGRFLETGTRHQPLVVELGVPSRCHTSRDTGQLQPRGRAGVSLLQSLG